MRALWNFLAFQAGWFACVLGGANHLPWLGVMSVFVLMVMHVFLAVKPGDELKLMGVTALIGIFWDSLLVSMGWLVYPSGTLVAGTAPVWIVALWLNLAMTLNLSLAWLKGRWKLAALFGAVGGPLAYYAGAKLGGVQFAEPAWAVVSLAVGWSVIMPLLTVLATRFNGFDSGVRFSESVSVRA